MDEILKEVIAKSIHDPADANGLTLVYQRGHELSGTVLFEMINGATFLLKADQPRQQRSLTFEGKLTIQQTTALLEAVEESDLLEIPSSTRNIGDDELPIIVELNYDDIDHRLLIWQEDALKNIPFQKFERALGSLLFELYTSQVVIAPNPKT